METIGLIAAMTQESEALLRCVKPWKRVAVGPLRGNSFVLTRQNCVLVTSGMGVRRASEAARNLVELNSPQMLISFGIAGAVEADLEIGDVVLAEAVCSLDQGVPGSLMPLEPWPDAARKAAAEVLVTRGRQLFTGTAVTTGGSQVMQSQLGEMRHPILEMETAGIAQVAAEKGIPLLSLRAISDGPRAPIPFDLGEIMDEDANLQAGRLLGAIARNPRIIFQSRQMMRNTKIAANNAAAALVAALRQQSSIADPHAGDIIAAIDVSLF
jgi:adenosylhomocysteine nucleosidase